MYKAGRQQEINFRFTRLPKLFHDKIITLKNKKKTKKERKEKKIKENYLVIIDAIRQGLQKIFPQVNKNLNLYHTFSLTAQKITQASRILTILLMAEVGKSISRN